MQGSKIVITLVIGIVALLFSAVQAREPAKTAEGKSVERSTETTDAFWNLDARRSELEAVIGRFIAAYSAGDIEHFMQLFTQVVHTPSGDKKVQDLRAEYAEHFLATTERYMNLSNARYQKSGDDVMAEVDLKLREHHKLDEKDHGYTGAIRFYLTRQGSRWLISGLYFAYDPPADATTSKR